MHIGSLITKHILHFALWSLWKVILHFLIWCSWLESGQISQYLTGRITFHRHSRAKCKIYFVIREPIGISGEMQGQKVFFRLSLVNSDGFGYLKLADFGYPNSAMKWVQGKLNKYFLHFWPNFCQFDDFSKFISAPLACSSLKNHQIWQKFGKSYCTTRLQTHYSMDLPKPELTWVSGIRIRH